MSIPGGIRMLEEGQWVSFKDPLIPDRLTKPLMVVDYENISDFGVHCLFVDLEGNIYSYSPKRREITCGDFYYHFKDRYEVLRHDRNSVMAAYGPRLNELIDHALKEACDHNYVLFKNRASLKSKFTLLSPEI